MNYESLTWRDWRWSVSASPLANERSLMNINIHKLQFPHSNRYERTLRRPLGKTKPRRFTATTVVTMVFLRSLPWWFFYRFVINCPAWRTHRSVGVSGEPNVIPPLRRYSARGWTDRVTRTDPDVWLLMWANVPRGSQGITAPWLGSVPEQTARNRRRWVSDIWPRTPAAPPIPDQRWSASVVASSALYLGNSVVTALHRALSSLMAWVWLNVLLI